MGGATPALGWPTIFHSPSAESAWRSATSAAETGEKVEGRIWSLGAGEAAASGFVLDRVAILAGVPGRVGPGPCLEAVNCVLEGLRILIVTLGVVVVKV
mmetsp:Transcript_4170/g.10329  ORF Transcript_4170/g.10329 Transcript_4170/m.10329 type:complete len:99 (+) Transcript_4170:2194-2490(+)